MATTPTYINQRINNLQSQINDIISGGGGGVPSSSVLAVILANGNSAGTSDINMNSNNITNANEITSDNDIIMSSNTANITLNALNSQIVSNSSSFVVNSGDYITLTANNDYMTLQADDDITIQSAGLGNINLNAPNINSYNWAMPICLNAFFEGGLFYTLNSQAIENVLVSNPLPTITLPPQFFSDTPQTGYISTRWQINFDMNIYHGSNLDDKGFAIYLLFVDGLGNTYTPFLYNSNTPFCRYALGAGYGGGGAPPYMSINWCDYVDFNQMVGTGNSDITVQMWVAGDDPISGDFRMKLGFTRINRL